MLGSVNPRNDAFAGGSITRTAPPPSASGSFTSVGASGFPAPGTPAIATARNNRGSNVPIPYARLVPVHGQDKLPVEDDRLHLNSKDSSSEYDGLESGELAWVLSRQFSIGTKRGYHAAVQYAGLPAMPFAMPDGSGLAQLQDMSNGLTGAEPHLVPIGAGGGFGVDRMQRMAYTGWMMSHFRHRMKDMVVNLKAYKMFDDIPAELSSLLGHWKNKGLTGSADMFAVPDLAYALQKPYTPLQVAKPMVQGLFVMERGPFLRSIGTSHYNVELHAHDTSSPSKDLVGHVSVDRHLGSSIAQAALETCLRENGIMNWIPDGVCLNKYETGPDPFADAHFDARMSQLFNVIVQGPAITKTWTGDKELICLPTDKLFVLVVADLSYSLDEFAPGVDSMTNLASEYTKLLAGLQRDVATNLPKNIDVAANRDILTSKYEPGKTAVGPDGSAGGSPDTFNAWKTAIDAYTQAVQTGASDDVKRNKREAAEKAWEDFMKTTGRGGEDQKKILERFDAHAAKVRNGKMIVKDAVLTNFRLKLSTSSHMASKSHYNPDDSTSRLGLTETFAYDGSKKKGVASFVVGGWCIGSVLDSAASRTMMGSVVRVSASSMAMNVNVNVEWWSPDRLYAKYQDKERYTKSTSDKKDIIATATSKDVSTISEVGIESYNSITIASAKETKPTSTLESRDAVRGTTSAKYSADLDVEAFDDSKKTSPADQAYTRAWDAASPSAPSGSGSGSGTPP